MKTNSTTSSERQLPAVHGALLELHVLASRLLAISEVRRSEIAHVRRSTLRAILAVGMASAGHRRRYHVRRAHEIITSCLHLFLVFQLEQLIDARVHDELRKRVTQILDALDQLTAATEAQWLTLALPPLEPVDEEPRTSPLLPALQSLLARVDTIVRSLASSSPHDERIDPGDATVTT